MRPEWYRAEWNYLYWSEPTLLLSLLCFIRSSCWFLFSFVQLHLSFTYRWLSCFLFFPPDLSLCNDALSFHYKAFYLVTFHGKRPVDQYGLLEALQSKLGLPFLAILPGGGASFRWLGKMRHCRRTIIWLAHWGLFVDAFSYVLDGFTTHYFLPYGYTFTFVT